MEVKFFVIYHFNEVIILTKKELRSMGDKIKAKRIQLGYTQEQAAELTELSFSTYSKIENAVQGPSLDALIRISTALDISMDYMIFGNKNVPENPPDFSDMLTLLKNADFEKIRYTCDLFSKLLSKIR